MADQPNDLNFALADKARELLAQRPVVGIGSVRGLDVPAAERSSR